MLRLPSRVRRARIFLGLLTVLFSSVEADENVARSDPSGVAAQWYVAVQTYSFHEHTSDIDLHNTTPGIGLLRRQENWLLGAGIFRNSIGRWAGYGYGGYQWPLGPVRLGGILGATHHYNANNGGIVPLAGAVATIPLGRNFEVDLIGIPRITNYTYNTLNVSFAWRFR